MRDTTRVLVLDDGETWEVVTNTSNALVVEVTDAELQQLHEGHPIDAVLSSRSGTRIAVLLDDVAA